MKRAFSVLVCVIMILTPVITLAESALSDLEQQYLGSWVMYMKSGSTTYLYTISFFDDMHVTLKTLVFNGSDLDSDHKASGKWGGFTSGTIILSLASNDFVGSINDDGLFCLLDFKTKEASGFFSRCPDLSDRLSN